MSGALGGIRVLDFSRLLPGPYSTWLLADMGAEVIRVENPREVAKQAKVFGWDKLPKAEWEKIRQNDILARNKQSVMLDIGNESAQQALLDLGASVDVVVEDYRPGVLAGLNLGYEAFKARNPGVVYCSLTLCGQTGPYRDKPGHDPVALSIAGVLSRVGEDPAAPGFAGIPAADVVTGTHAAFGILAAVHARSKDGLGQHVDIAMSDCSMSLLVNVLSRHPDLDQIPPRGARRADMGLWRTKDGKFICTTDMEPRYWQVFCQTIGRPDFIALQNDIASRPMIREALETIFAAKTQDEWLAILAQADTQFAPVLSVAEAMQDPHNIARGMVQDVQGAQGAIVRQLGVPVKLSRTAGAIRHLAALPGANTHEVLLALGKSQAEIERMAAHGAFGGTPEGAVSG